MKRILLIVLTLCILAVLNVAIYQKEQIRRGGETVFLELAPADPRSLMQGDYMRLNYAINRQFPGEILRRAGAERGQVVIKVDEASVASFVRIHQGEQLQAGEKLMHYSAMRWFVSIQPNSFFFQEGQAAAFERAKYGRFKFAGDRDYLLVGLADADRTPLDGKAPRQQ